MPPQPEEWASAAPQAGAGATPELSRPLSAWQRVSVAAVVVLWPAASCWAAERTLSTREAWAGRAGESFECGSWGSADWKRSPACPQKSPPAGLPHALAAWGPQSSKSSLDSLLRFLRRAGAGRVHPWESSSLPTSPPANGDVEGRGSAGRTPARRWRFRARLVNKEGREAAAGAGWRLSAIAAGSGRPVLVAEVG